MLPICGDGKTQSPILLKDVTNGPKSLVIQHDIYPKKRDGYAMGGITFYLQDDVLNDAQAQRMHSDVIGILTQVVVSNIFIFTPTWGRFPF